MNGLIALNNQALTMSSREIATLLNKQHSNVRKSAERLAKSGTIALQETPYVNEQNGQTYYEYNLNKRDSLILVAQNCPEFTAAIVDRWQELEAMQAPQIPQTYAAALLEAGRLALEVEQQARQLEVKTKKVEQLESLFHSGGTIAQFAKQMNGLNSQAINAWLYANTNWLYDENKGKIHLSGRNQGKPKPSSWRCAAYARDKYLTETTYNIERQGREPIVKYEVQLLAGGKKWLFDKYIAGKLPMKSDWNGDFTHKKDLN